MQSARTLGSTRSDPCLAREKMSRAFFVKDFVKGIRSLRSAGLWACEATPPISISFPNLSRDVGPPLVGLIIAPARTRPQSL